MRVASWMMLSVALSPLVACGDMSESTGELGRVEYSLHTDVITDGSSLSGALLVAGHPLNIQTALTEDGAREAGRHPERLRHRFDDASVQVENETNDDEIADLVITAEAGIDGDLETVQDGEVFDYLPLSFREPDDLGAITFVRGPMDDEMEEVDGAAHTVVEGGSATLLGFPKRDGERLVGDIRPELTLEPEGIAVPDFDVAVTVEQGAYGAISPYTVVFIEPGEVTATLTDPVWGVTVTRTFTVQPFAD